MPWSGPLTALVAIVVLVALVAVPDVAWAWGPVSHMVHGSSVLANITSLPAGLQAVLGAHQDRYLYGCVGADIIQAKFYAKSIATHCHRWTVAWAFVERARTDGQRAFAWGYMTHLAADIISHNHFVPANLLRSFDKRTLGHAYWEARADSVQRRRHWQLVREVLLSDYGDCDTLVEEIVENTLFSFKTNKRIFDSLMAVSKLERWQLLVKNLAGRSRLPLSRHTVDRYNEACLRCALDLLGQGRNSFTQLEDPTGKDMLRRAIALRRRLRTLKRERRLQSGAARDMARELLPHLDELSQAV
ncbi:MAG: zinc dependent phospholipase C family protein [Deltaproteobacteria bacterium]